MVIDQLACLLPRDLLLISIWLQLVIVRICYDIKILCQVRSTAGLLILMDHFYYVFAHLVIDSVLKWLHLSVGLSVALITILTAEIIVRIFI